MSVFTTTTSVTIFFFFFNDTATTEIYTLSLHDALPICGHRAGQLYPLLRDRPAAGADRAGGAPGIPGLAGAAAAQWQAAACAGIHGRLCQGRHPQCRAAGATGAVRRRSEERRVGKECRSRWSP